MANKKSDVLTYDVTDDYSSAAEFAQQFDPHARVSREGVIPLGIVMQAGFARAGDTIVVEDRKIVGIERPVEEQESTEEEQESVADEEQESTEEVAPEPAKKTEAAKK